MNKELLSDALSGIGDRHIAEAAEAVSRRRVTTLRRAAVIVAAAALCLALALPALAASDGTYELLYAVAPALAQRFKPVQLSCEDNGIRMEVVAAAVQGGTAEAYIALRDLEGDRVDETCDLFDSWRFHTPFDSINTCRLESFDPETRTALFYVRMSTLNGEDIRTDNSKITFSVGEFLSGKQTIEGVDLQGVLEDLDPAPATQFPTSIRGGDGLGIGFSLPPILCLVPAEEPLMTPVDGIEITGAGYVDGRLHIQAYYRDIFRADNHGFLYFLDENGQEVCSTLSLLLWDSEQTGSYQEYIFDIPPEALAAYSLWGDFYTGSLLTEGSWQVTFPLDGSN